MKFKNFPYYYFLMLISNFVVFIYFAVNFALSVNPTNKNIYLVINFIFSIIAAIFLLVYSKLVRKDWDVFKLKVDKKIYNYFFYGLYFNFLTLIFAIVATSVGVFVSSTADSTFNYDYTSGLAMPLFAYLLIIFAVVLLGAGMGIFLHTRFHYELGRQIHNKK